MERGRGEREQGQVAAWELLLEFIHRIFLKGTCVHACVHACVCSAWYFGVYALSESLWPIRASPPHCNLRGSTWGNKRTVGPMQFSIVISFHFLVMSGNKDSSLISEETKMTLGELLSNFLLLLTAASSDPYALVFGGPFSIKMFYWM